MVAYSWPAWAVKVAEHNPKYAAFFMPSYTSFGYTPVYQSNQSAIHRSSIDGTQHEVLLSIDNAYVFGVTLDVSSGGLYWTEYENGRIRRSNLDGGDVSTVLADAEGAEFIKIDLVERKMYWTAQGWPHSQFGLLRANLDGSKRENLGVGHAWGLAIDESPLGFPCIGDVSGNLTVDIDDLVAVITAWGPCLKCPQDFDKNGAVDDADLAWVLTHWTH